MGDGLKRVAAQCDGLTVKARGRMAKYTAKGKLIEEWSSITFYIVQQPCRHKPPGPYWTGERWSANAENKKVYADFESAANDLAQAGRVSERPVQVMDSAGMRSLIFKPRRGV